VETETRATKRNTEPAESEIRPDLVWDDRGRDPARENRGREIPPVENIIQYIAENLVPKP
jgi:hypothetical protein